MEAHNLGYNTSFHSIVGFCHVYLQSHVCRFPLSSIQIVPEFMVHYRIIRYISLRDEGGLGRRDKPF